MKNKGFVLMETIIVIVVISVALLTIFSSYNKILRKVKTENKYDTSEYVYMTKYIKDNLYDLCSYTPSVNSISDSNIREYSICLGSNNVFNVKKIYILKGLNNVGEYAEKFDAYMIDYLRKLDVGAEDELIIVEYRKPSMDRNYSQKKLTSTYVIEDEDKLLYETYIASLEW